jgi:inner membrane protein
MDNVTHTLFGLCLAKAGLDRTTPLATATLLISSNLPDIDAAMRLRGSLSNLEYHRGITHSFVGLAVLAGLFTLLLTVVDRRYRTRRDPFRRPIRPPSVFLLAYLGGLGHMFMDFTNSYGVRPLLPFSDRWFYGDLAFVADPWIWLILGSAAVWLTAKSLARGLVWMAIGTGLALLVALAFRSPSESLMAIPPLPVPVLVRVIWFIGLAALVLGALLGWGRAGPKVARYSLVFLALYYCGMWTAKRSAMEQARNSLTASGAISVAVWPEPGNPLRWQSVAAFRDSLFARHITVGRPGSDWQELPALDARFADALRQTREGKVFLDFARYVSATVEEREDGYTVALRDLRLPVRMSVRLNADLAVQSTDFRWF